ncbi:DUF3426 domain-containing protein [uncultured Ramlibacter sp.]|uniref:DUF3426 domain-containing protein n=1 Tax=uncultured Ramlibacter sp. TaxID=260755 RepID=UPI00261659D1|nr:DUF3426 domain-containing protein [uncultured Ramlibacter sp.]
MSLITCCPACGTMFKVVPDQLRISEGWVRCGHCAEVFDASAHLHDGAMPVSGPPAAPPPQAQIPQQPEPLPETLADAASGEPAADAQADDGDSLAPLPQPQDLSYPPFALSHADGSDDDGAAVAAPVDSAWDAPPEADLQDVSFVRQARRKAFWRRPGVRAVLVLAGLALAALLAAQLAIHDRDRLAASQPGLRPLLEALCDPLHCSVGTPRQIEAVVIDSSSFNKLRSDAYRLNLTLKNQTAMLIAMPAIELTLTDSQDQAVLRRVLTPADMGASAGVIGAASEWTGSLALSVAPGSSAGRISGYRLLAFYP